MSAGLKQAMAGVREPTPYEKFRGRLEQMRPEFAALTGQQNVERFIRIVCNAVQTNPKLLDADGRSLLLSCLKAAQDGLLPDGREAVLNIFNTKEKVDGVEKWINKVQYMPMVGGLVKKLYASGIRLVDAVAVNKMDRFEYQRGDDPKIVHVPYDGDEEPGNVVAAYVRVILDNGEVKREVMFRRDIEKAHHQSQPYKTSVRYEKDETGPWVDWYDQMAIKTVLHRVYKQLPSTIELDATLEADDEAMGFKAGADLDRVLLPQTAAAGGEPPPTEFINKKNADANAAYAESQSQQNADPMANRAHAAETVDKGTGEIINKGAPVVTVDIVTKKLMEETDIDLLDAHADLINEVPDDTADGSIRATLEKLYHECRAKLTQPKGGKKK